MRSVDLYTSIQMKPSGLPRLPTPHFRAVPRTHMLPPRDGRTPPEAARCPNPMTFREQYQWFSRYQTLKNRLFTTNIHLFEFRVYGDKGAHGIYIHNTGGVGAPLPPTGRHTRRPHTAGIDGEVGVQSTITETGTSTAVSRQGRHYPRPAAMDRYKGALWLSK